MDIVLEIPLYLLIRILIDQSGEFWDWVGPLPANAAWGAAMSGTQYMMTADPNDPDFSKKLGASLISGAAGGALKFGTQYMLGNVLTWHPVANAFTEIGMSGLGTT